VTKVTGKYVVVLNTGEKAHFQDMEMLVRYVLAYCPIGEVSKKELNKTTDNYLQTSNLRHTILKFLKLLFKQPDYCYFASLPLYDASFQNSYPHTKRDYVFCSWHTLINSCRVNFAQFHTELHRPHCHQRTNLEERPNIVHTFIRTGTLKLFVLWSPLRVWWNLRTIFQKNVLKCIK